MAAAVAGPGCDRAPVRTAPWRVVLLEPSDPPPPPAYREGLLEGLGEAATGEPPQFGWQTVRAPAESLAALAAQAAAEGADLMLAVSSAGLAAAVSAGPAVVFTDVADPGRSGVRAPSFLATWLPALFGSPGPAVTGAFGVSDFGALLEAAAPVMPVDGGLGTVFVAGDVDSVAYRDQLRALADRSVTSVPLDPAAPAAAVRALCEQQVRTLVLLGDRSTDAVVADILGAARACRMVVLGTRRAHAEAGAVLTLARDERAAAVAAGRRAAALMRGGRPQDGPFERVAATQLVLNAQAAEIAAVGLPLSLLAEADDVIGD